MERSDAAALANCFTGRFLAPVRGPRGSISIHIRFITYYGCCVWTRPLSALIVPKTGEELVHVLIVGVAGYEAAEGHISPVELHGIVKSVERAARFWCISDTLLRGRKIGSVEVLLSPGSQSTELVDKDGFPLEGATFANVRLAFDAWRARCVASPDSLAVLHWLGHGAAEMAPARNNNPAINLFCYDVDVGDPNSPVQRGVSLSKTIWSLKSLSFAQNALLFIDACRTSPRGNYDVEYEAAVSTSPSPTGGKNNRITSYTLQYHDTRSYCFQKEMPECGFQGGSVITEAVLDALEHFAWPQKEEQPPVGQENNLPVFASNIACAVNRRLAWWEPYLGLSEDVRCVAFARKRLLVCVQKLSKAMVKLIVSPVVKERPKVVELVASEPYECSHESYERSALNATPMVYHEPAFRAEVAVGGWCASLLPTEQKEELSGVKHSYVHAYQNYLCNLNWCP